MNKYSHYSNFVPQADCYHYFYLKKHPPVRNTDGDPCECSFKHYDNWYVKTNNVKKGIPYRGLGLLYKQNKNDLDPENINYPTIPEFLFPYAEQEPEVDEETGDKYTSYAYALSIMNKAKNNYLYSATSRKKFQRFKKQNPDVCPYFHFGTCVRGNECAYKHISKVSQ